MVELAFRGQLACFAKLCANVVVECRVHGEPFLAVGRIEPEVQYRLRFAGRVRHRAQCPTPTALARLCMSRSIECRRGSWRCNSDVMSLGPTRAMTRSNERS